MVLVWPSVGTEEQTRRSVRLKKKRLMEREGKYIDGR